MDRQTQQAMQLQRQGKFEEASQAWQRILHSNPAHVPALANLASLQARAGHPKRAIKLFKRALKADPRIPEIWFNLGNLMNLAGDRVEAERSYRQALKLNNEFAPAWNNLGALLRDVARSADAIKCFRKAIEIAPGLVRAHCAYADLMLEQEDLAEALKHYTLARESDPTEPLAYLGLGNVLAENRQYMDAIEAFKGGLSLQPGSERFLVPLAELFMLTGQELHAATAWQSVLESNPDSPDAHLNLGRLHYRLRSNSEDVRSAIKHLRHAAALRSGHVETECQLGFTLAEIGQLGEADKIAKRTVKNHQNSALAHMLDGFVAVQQARTSDGLSAYRNARKLAPNDPIAMGNLCFSSLYADFMDPEKVTQLHREMSRAISTLIQPDFERTARETGGKVRIGYLSPDFRGHPVAYFMEPVLTHHDRESFKVFGYANVARLDATGQALAGSFDHFRLCAGLDDDSLLKMLREDRLDVLIDLAGYTANNRIGVLARRAAPVQAVYLGYPCTTGLEQIDYCIGDEPLMPADSDDLYSERPIRLGSPFLCFQPRPGTPDVAPLPAIESSHITFGSYNNYAKVSDHCVQVWARILERVPDSVLVLKAQALTDPDTCEMARMRFSVHGIEPNRIITQGPTSPVPAFLGEYGNIDIALDTLPYNGGTTSCDALWMGVPVVSLAGQHFYQRMGASILHSAGHAEWCADSDEAYVDIAVNLAQDLDELSRIRTQLRPAMRTSALCDGEKLAHELERAYVEMVKGKQ